MWKIQFVLSKGLLPLKKKPVREKEVKSEFHPVEKNLYHIPTRNKKTGKIEVNTLLKEDLSPITEINEMGPQQDFVNYKKPVLLDTTINRQTKLDLDKLHDVNKDAFAEDEMPIGTTPLIQMSVDTGDHPPIAKKPYTLALKHYDWLKEEIDKLLEAGVMFCKAVLAYQHYIT